MITLHLCQWLDDEGFGTLDTDIFWEEAPLDSRGNPKPGIWVVSRSPAIDRKNIGVQNFDIYARYPNKVTSAQKLNDILKRLQEAYGDTCTLPTVPNHSDIVYTNVMIEPTSGVDNVGSDEQENIVKVISGVIHYKES